MTRGHTSADSRSRWHPIIDSPRYRLISCPCSCLSLSRIALAPVRPRSCFSPLQQTSSWPPLCIPLDCLYRPDSSASSTLVPILPASRSYSPSRTASSTITATSALLLRPPPPSRQIREDILSPGDRLYVAVDRPRSVASISTPIVPARRLCTETTP